MRNGPTDADQRSIGLQSVVVRIDSVTDDYIQVVDDFGRLRQLDAHFRRGSGVKPRVGERWIIDTYYGPWTLAGQTLADPPHVTGDRKADVVTGTDAGNMRVQADNGYGTVYSMSFMDNMGAGLHDTNDGESIEAGNITKSD